MWINYKYIYEFWSEARIDSCVCIRSEREENGFWIKWPIARKIPIECMRKENKDQLVIAKGGVRAASFVNTI
jgi:hypothetical protein